MSLNTISRNTDGVKKQMEYELLMGYQTQMSYWHFWLKESPRCWLSEAGNAQSNSASWSLPPALAGRQGQCSLPWHSTAVLLALHHGLPLLVWLSKLFLKLIWTHIMASYSRRWKNNCLVCSFHSVKQNKTNYSSSFTRQMHLSDLTLPYIPSFCPDKDGKWEEPQHITGRKQSKKSHYLHVSVDPPQHSWTF